MKRRVLTILSILFALISAMAVFSACNSSDEKGVSGEEMGVYYCEVNGKEYLLTLAEETAFSLEMGDETREGTYVLDDAALTLKFSDGGDPATAEGTLENDTLRLTDYRGGGYTFLKKITYTVKFSGADLDDVEVTNGKTVAKPKSPVEEGQVFIGWYTDSAFRSLYDFSQPVRGNLTLYARFVAKLDPEFTVSFDVNGGEEEFEPVETVGGKVFSLPTPTKAGAEFAGWWVSHTDSAEKLTYQYKEQQLFENTTLHAVWKSAAPLVSITETGVTWSADGLNNSFTFKFTGPTGTVITEITGGQFSYAYDFSTQAAGEYIAEVTLNGNTTTAYYTNKILARVSVFKTEESVLYWNEVADAEKYLISYVCGTQGHTHADIECPEASYDFGDCDMLAEGLSFTVKAVADDHVTSVSRPFVYERTLAAAAPGGNTATDTVSWAAVEKATSYFVDVKQNGTSVDGYPKNVGNVLSVDLKTLPQGSYTVEVTPVAKGWNSPAAQSAVYTKTRIAAPSEIRLDGSNVSWNAIDSATGYEVTFDGKTYSTSSAEFPLLDEYHKAGQIEYVFTVRAIAADEAASSLGSDEFTIRNGEMGELSYTAGVLTWQAVWGVSGYVVKVGEDGEEISLDVPSYAPTYTQKGETTLYVCAILPGGTRSDWAQLTQTVYALYFDPNDVSRENGSTTAESTATLFKAFGDALTLPADVARTGYSFVGWYTSADGSTAYTSAQFEEHSDYTLFAKWEAKQYTVTLDVGTYGQQLQSTTKTVTFDHSYELTVPEPSNVIKGFRGWFTGADGTGSQRTDYDGKSVADWATADDVTLHAAWVDVFAFTYLPNQKGYAVSKGSGIGYVREVKIPVKYENEPVITVSDFSSQDNLEIINIPDTILNISLETQATAFRFSDGIKEINIYSVSQAEQSHEPVYSSHEGVLYHLNDKTGNKELVYFPAAKEGSYSVENGATAVTEGAFQYAEKVTELIFPASMTLLEKHSIYSIDALTTVTFRPHRSTDDPQPLELREEAFFSCSNLTTITFPNRLAELPEKFVSGCSKLENINIDETAEYAEQIYTSEGGLLCKYVNGKSGAKELIYLPVGRSGVLELPTNVTSIGDGAAKANKELTGLVVHANLRNIGKEAFRQATKLENIEFKGDALSEYLTIDEYAFYGCTNLYLHEIVLPENLVTLGAHAFGGFGSVLNKITVRVESGAAGQELNFADGAFANDDNESYVTSVYLGKAVKVFNIGGVFGKRLAEVTVDKENASLSDQDGVLFDKNVENIVFYPAGKTGDYILPDTVKSIGANVFEGRENLTGITIGLNVADIGVRAFASCSGLTHVTFTAPGAETERVKLTIGANAFEACSQLTSIELPENTVEIGSCAFKNCLRLESITIPSSVEQLGMPEATRFDLFENCSSLNNITIHDGKSYITRDGILYSVKDGQPSELMYAPLSKTGEVNVPKTVVNIWEAAFKGNTGVTALKFPDGLAETTDAEGNSVPGTLELQMDAFNGCTALMTVELPVGLSKIGTSVFANCVALSSVTIPYTVSSLEPGSFSGCVALSEVKFDKTPEGQKLVDLRLEDGTIYSSSSDQHGTVVTPAAGVFTGAVGLTNIELPERTVYIGIGAFSGTGLQSVTIPSTVQEIATDAFRELPLTNIDFKVDPESKRSSLHTIHSSAFYGLHQLKSLVLPEGLRQLGETELTSVGAFRDSALESLTLPSSLEIIGTTAFYGNQYGEVQPSLGDIEFKEGLREICNSAFSYSGVTSVKIPKSVKTIGTSVFNGCPITSIDFADDSELEELTNAFAGSDIETINFGKNAKFTEIGLGAFDGCYHLQSIVIPASVETIYQRAFDNCTSLSSITWETDENGKTKVSNLKKIGTSTSSLNTTFNKNIFTEFTFPESNSTIELLPGIFAGANKLKTLKLSNQVTNLGSALQGCGSLEFIVIPEDHPTLSTKEGEKVVYDQTGKSIMLVFGEAEETVTLEEGALEVGATAFYRQPNVKHVLIPASLEKIGDSAFAECNALEDVVIAKDSQLNTIGLQAFAYDANLKSINFENATKLTTFTAPLSSTMNYPGAFYKCTSLTSVDLSHTQLETLQKGLFQGCTSLTEVKLPNTFKHFKGARLTSNNQYQSDGCVSCFTDTAITSITLPKSFETFEVGGNANGTGRWFSLGLKNTLETLDFGGAQVKYIPSFSDYVALKNVYANGAEDKETYGTEPGIFVIPSSVTQIASSAFKNCTQLQEVHFEGCDSLETIGTSVFEGCTAITKIDMSGATKLDRLGTTSVTAVPSATANVFKGCTSLQEVVLPANVKYLGGSTFEGCTNLKTVYYAGATRQENVVQLPADISLGNNSFKGSGVEKVILPALSFSLTIAQSAIGTNLFQNCTSLTEVVLQDGLGAIQQNMFDGCTSLTKVGVADEKGVTTNKLPSSVAYIAQYAFHNCSALESIDLSALPITEFTNFSTKTTTGTYAPNGIKTTTSVYTFQGCTNLTKVVLPEKFTTLGAYAFDGCGMLSDINLGNITFIGNYAFRGSGLKAIDLKNVGTLGTYAFQNSTALKTVDLGTSALTAIPNYTFSGCTSLDSVTLSAKIGNTGTYTFQNCESLESIDLSKATALTTIGNYAFAGAGLTSVTIPATVTTINTYAFNGCASLATLDLSGASKLNSIGNYAFNGCASLATLDLSGATVLGSIGNYAFADGALTKVKLSKAITKLGTGAFEGNADLNEIDTNGSTHFSLYNEWLLLNSDMEVVYVLVGKGEAKVGEDGTVTFNGDCKLGSYMFEGVDFIKKIVIEDGITEIPDYAFYNSNIPEIEIAESVTKVGQYAFAGSHFTSITLGTGMTSIGNYAFANSFIDTVSIQSAAALSSTTDLFNGAAVTTVTLPEELTAIGNNWFKDTASLTTFELPASVTKIGNAAFQNSALTSITIPSALTSMPTSSGNAPFSGSKLATVIYQAATVPNYAFYGAAELVTFTFEVEEFTTIGNSAFYGCALLTEFELPATTTSIGSSTFQGTALGGINIPETVTTIGSSAFKEVPLTSLTLPEGLDKIDTTAFAGTHIASVTIPSTVATIGQGAFSGIAELTELIFAPTAEDAEPVALTITDGATSETAATAGAFEGTALVSVALPGRLKAVGASAFRNVATLTSVTMEDGTTEIKALAFFGTGITQISIPDSVTKFGNYAFAETKLTSIVLPSTTSSLGSGLFRNCADLVTAQFKDDTSALTSSFAANCFQGCVKLKTFVLPEGITQLNTELFLGCTSLESVKIPSTATTIQKNVFSGCTSLKLFVPETITTIMGTGLDGLEETQTVYFENTAYTFASSQSSSYHFEWFATCKAKIVWGISYEDYLQAIAAPNA